ncbi:hypothetical protein Zmor_002210 [Zophobas morio]|uniref:Uncharacterized protein n=1 Tax=Zophobas morio TaxID=2755281 RepID=A0AA38JAW5_9CUCU|nr:hypothetical protein Zmor_002210 [Zophobas morio]
MVCLLEKVHCQITFSIKPSAEILTKGIKIALNVTFLTQEQTSGKISPGNPPHLYIFTAEPPRQPGILFKFLFVSSYINTSSEVQKLIHLSVGLIDDD